MGMALPVTFLTWAGAALPIALLLFLLIVRKWPVVQASAIGAASALIIGYTLYDAPLSVIGGEIGKGVWSSVSIIAVIIPAILIYEVSYETRAFSAIQRDLTRLIPDKLLQVLAIGWCFTSFLQGPSGFGVPVAVSAPLLIGIGVKPFWAVLIPLMAHAWANTFGTLALGWDALVQQTFLQNDSAAYWVAALWTGFLTGILCVVSGALICFFYRGISGLRHGFPAIIVLGGIMAVGQAALSQVAPMLCTVIPTTAALGAVFLLAKMRRYAKHDPEQSNIIAETIISEGKPVNLTLHEALLPYYALVGVSVLVLLIPPITSLFSAWKISIPFPKTVTGYGFVNHAYPAYGPVSPLTHSGFFLFVASLVAIAYYGMKGVIPPKGTGRILINTLQKSVPSAASVAFLLVMSKTMTGSGQVEVLAMGTAAATGGYFALLSPLIGTLGSFMSSSNVSSNILFGQFQESMAQLTGRNPAILLAAQTSGATIGTMFSPSKVLLATTTAGIIGQEGAIIKKLLPVSLFCAAIMGAITFFCA